MNEPRAIYISEALEMAIKALEQESCEDCISRQAAIEIARDNIHYGLDKKYEYSRELLQKTMAEINSLPSVTPQSKIGHWILYRDYKNMVDYPQCDNCGVIIKLPLPIDNLNYCPNCGVKMIEPQERSGEE